MYRTVTFFRVFIIFRFFFGFCGKCADVCVRSRVLPARKYCVLSSVENNVLSPVGIMCTRDLCIRVLPCAQMPALVWSPKMVPRVLPCSRELVPVRESLRSIRAFENIWRSLQPSCIVKHSRASAPQRYVAVKLAARGKCNRMDPVACGLPAMGENSSKSQRDGLVQGLPLRSVWLTEVVAAVARWTSW